MTRALPLFRPGLLAAAISLASICTAALADSYQLPAAPLASTLTQIASQAGIVLSIDPALTEGKQSAPVQGDYDALEALHQALRGSGLQLQHSSAGNTFGDQANSELGFAKSYTVFDAAVHYDLGRLDNSLSGASLALNATNLLNKGYISTCDSYYCYYGDQRSVVASATYKW